MIHSNSLYDGSLNFGCSYSHLASANGQLENLFCAGTYEKILATIAKPALSRATVKFLTKVVQIETVDDFAQVLGENGLHEKFDEVVVTLPLGWLKINKIAFYPQLPTRLCQAIDAIGYGSLEKACNFHFLVYSLTNLNRYTSLSLEPFGFTEILQRKSSRDSHNIWPHCMPAIRIPSSGIKRV